MRGRNHTQHQVWTLSAAERRATPRAKLKAKCATRRCSKPTSVHRRASMLSSSNSTFECDFINPGQGSSIYLNTDQNKYYCNWQQSLDPNGAFICDATYAGYQRCTCPRPRLRRVRAATPPARPAAAAAFSDRRRRRVRTTSCKKFVADACERPRPHERGRVRGVPHELKGRHANSQFILGDFGRTPTATRTCRTAARYSSSPPTSFGGTATRAI